MKKRRFSVEQIVGVPKQAEVSVPVAAGHAKPIYRHLLPFGCLERR